MRFHNEESQVIVTAEIFDTDKNPHTPTTARYRLDDCRSEEEMIDWTTVTPSSVIEITVPGSINTIVNDRNKAEQKVLTLNTDQGLSTQNNFEYLYGIKNLRFVNP